MPANPVAMPVGNARSGIPEAPVRRAPLRPVAVPLRAPAGAKPAWEVSHFVCLDGSAWPVFARPAKPAE